MRRWSRQRRQRTHKLAEEAFGFQAGQTRTRNADPNADKMAFGILHKPLAARRPSVETFSACEKHSRAHSDVFMHNSNLRRRDGTLEFKDTAAYGQRPEALHSVL